MSSAQCRIFLFTYRRSHLLGRALQSLLSQTFTRWVCEVHNDDPTDPEPGRLVDQLGDARISIIDHQVNLGAMASYNLAFTDMSEPYMAMLQDDNWWNEDFLASMIGLLEQRPEAEVAVSNQWLAVEQADGSWQHPGKSVHPVEDRVYEIQWPHWNAVAGARYADGATVMRSDRLAAMVVPDEAPFDLVEAIRERTFRVPILFAADPKAHFAVTRETARGRTHGLYGACQAWLATAFFRDVGMDSSTVGQWVARKSQAPVPPWTLLILCGLAGPDSRWLWRWIPLGGWLRFLAGALKRPAQFWQTIWALRKDHVVRQFIDRVTGDQAGNLKKPGRFNDEEVLCLD